MNAVKPSATSSSVSSLAARFNASLLALLGAVAVVGCGDDGPDNCPGEVWDNCCEFIEKCDCELYVPGTDETYIETLDFTNVCLVGNENKCWTECQSAYGQVVDVWPYITPCNNDDTAGTDDCALSAVCVDWDPSAYIAGTGNSREIYQGLIDGLEADPTPLLRCDTARLVSGNVIQHASTDDALYEAGLRNGDVLVTLNGWSIDTPSELALAVGYHWLLNADYSLVLVVNRGGTPTTLLWDIIPPTI